MIEIPDGATARKPIPIILLVDVSYSMEPVGIQQANNGIRDYIEELQSNEDTRDSVFISVITFSDIAETIIEHQPIGSIDIPQIEVGAGYTNLDAGLAEVLALVERNKNELKKGKEPLFVFITDGNPNCSEQAWKDQLQLMNENPLIGTRPSGRVAGIRVIAGAGDDINDSVLTAFYHKGREKSHIVRLKDQATISGFFKNLRTLTVEISEKRPISEIPGTQLVN